MKLYAFDGIDQRLELLPLAARRALDLAGLRLSREGFLSLAHAERVLLTSAGAEYLVDLVRVARLVAAVESLLERPEPDEWRWRNRLRARAEHLAALTRPGSEPHGIASAALAQLPPE